MARPKKKVEEKQLRALLRLMPTLEDCAAFFEVSTDTIERRCKQFGKCSFAEFRAQNMVHTRLELKRKALTQAMSGKNNTMLIFCLKNLADWSDKSELDLKSTDGSMSKPSVIILPANGREAPTD